MFSIIFGLIHGLLNVYKLLVIAYCVISLMGISANKWTELLRSVVEPLLLPIRKVGKTARLYPRKSGTPSKKPLG